MSPHCRCSFSPCFSAVKCTISRASAQASVIAGTVGERGYLSEPVISRREKQKNGPCFGSVKRMERADHSAGASSLARGYPCQYRFGIKTLEANRYLGSSNEEGLEAYLSYIQMESVSVFDYIRTCGSDLMGLSERGIALERFCHESQLSVRGVGGISNKHIYTPATLVASSAWCTAR